MITETTAKSNQNEIIPAAQGYAKLGLKVIKVKGKRPIGNGWQKTPAPTVEQIALWDGRHNIGIVTGRLSNNLVIIDFDGWQGYHKFKRLFPDLADSYTVASGGGNGAHLYLFADELPEKTTKAMRVDLGDGQPVNVELKSDGQQCVAPPSIHPDTGKPYTIHHNAPILRVNNLAAVVAWIEGLKPEKPEPRQIEANYKPVEASSTRAQHYANAAYNRALDELARTGEGGRNDMLFKTAAGMFGRALGNWPDFDMARIEADLTAVARGIGLGAWETQNTINSARKSAQPVALELPDRPAPIRSKTDEHGAPLFTPVETYEPVATITGEAQYISELPIPDGDVLLISDTGTGKTTWAAQQGIDLSLTHRVALGAALSAALDLEYYQGLTAAQIRQIHKLLITHKSLWKMIPLQGSIRQPDTLFIDEITAFLADQRSEIFTADEAETAYELIKQLVKSARRLILADAYADDIVTAWAAQVRGKPLTVVKNTYTRQRGPLTMWEKKSGLMAQLWALADEYRKGIEGIRRIKPAGIAAHSPRCWQGNITRLRRQKRAVVVPTDSAELAKEIERLAVERYGAAQVMCIYQEVSADPDVKSFLKHINDRMNDYRVVIYSPSVESGIDIQAPVRAQAAFFVGVLSAPRQHQILNRCRNAAENHVYMPRKNLQLETDWQAIYNRHWQNAISTGRAANFDDYGVPVATDTQKSLFKLLAMFEARENASKNRLFDHFMTLAQGYSSITNNAAESVENKTKHAEMRAAIQQEADEATLQADPIDRPTYEARLEAGHKQSDLLPGYNRWRIEKATGREITPELLTMFRKPEQRGQLYLLTDVLCASKNELAERDRAQGRNSLHKRQHSLRKVTLIRDLIWRIFNDDMPHGNEIDREYVEEETARFMAANGDELRRLFGWRADLSESPRAFLRRVLGAMGLRLVAIRHGKADNRRHYYRVENCAVMLALANTSRARYDRDRMAQGTKNMYRDISPIHKIGTPAPDEPPRPDEPPPLTYISLLKDDWRGYQIA